MLIIRVSILCLIVFNGNLLMRISVFGPLLRFCLCWLEEKSARCCCCARQLCERHGIREDVQKGEKARRSAVDGVFMIAFSCTVSMGVPR